MRKLYRQRFKSHDSNYKRTVKKTSKVDVGWIATKLEDRECLVIEDVPLMERVQHFVSQVGQENIQQICEYRQALWQIGDDQQLNIVIFYWAETEIIPQRFWENDDGN